MSGDGPINWNEEDRATFGEMIARCHHATCRVPMQFVTGPTLVILRCSMGHILEIHQIYPEPWFS